MPNVPTEQRKRELVDAAVNVIAEHGVSGATTRRIAEAAGAALATLHYCFTRKEDLYLEVYRYLSDEFSNAIVDVEPTDLGATASDYLRASVDWMITHENYALAQLDLYVWLLRRDQALAGAAYRPFFDQLVPLLRAAAPDEPAEFIENLATILLATLDGVTLQWFSHRDSRRAERDVEFECSALEALIKQDRHRVSQASA